MGFRDPITTAGAVDTGQPSGAGARLYSLSSASGVSGVLEFRDGISGDSPATVSGSANLVPQGGGYTAQGGALTLTSGTYNGIPTPVRLTLGVEAAGAFGYRPAARISQGFEPIATGFVTWSNGFRDYPSAAFERPRCTQQADGSVLFSGLVQNNSGATRGAVGSGITIGALPAGYAPAQIVLGQAIGQGGILVRIDLNPDGSIVYNDSPGLVSGGYLSIRTNYRLDTTPSA